MSRPISKKQLVDLWWEEFSPKGKIGCIICGGSGKIDTRGKVLNGKGEDAGGEAWCICPNGRAFKRAVEKARRENEA